MPTLVRELQCAVERHSRRVAIVDGGAQIEYHELWDQACRLARDIQSSVSQRNPVIAVLARHGRQAIEALLAGQLINGIVTCLPTDASLSRLRVLCRHSRAELVIADSAHIATAHSVVSHGQSVFELNGRRADSRRSGPPRMRAESQTPSMIIYTSGTTQKPRGVLHAHQSLHANSCYHRDSLPLNADDREILLAKLSTISGVTDTFRILFGGGCLIPFDLGRESLGELVTTMLEQQPSIVHFVPTVFRRFVQHPDFEAQCFQHLRFLHLGGEPVTRSDFDLYHDSTPPHCRLLNNYGCTEVPTIRQGLFSHGDRPQGHRLALSIAVPGKSVFVMDKAAKNHPTSAARTGEIYIRTQLAAQGYWRNEPLTHQTFQRRQPGDPVVYRTRDRGSLGPDGSLIHLGREDGQIKVHGQFVDLPSVESQLSELACVKEVAIEVERTPEICLWAHCATDKPVASRAGTLIEHLHPDLRHLPLRFVLCDALPTLPNGKIDRNQLSGLRNQQHAGPCFDDGRRSAENLVRPALASLWRSALATEEDDPWSSFIECGGDSLRATELAVRIQRQFKVPISASDVFRAGTLGGLEQRLSTTCQAASNTVDEFEYLALSASATEMPERPVIICVGDHRPLPLLQDQFGKQVELVSLLMDGLQTDRFRALDVAAQVNAYVAELKRAGRDRPLAVVGFSYGGLLAYELSRQLALAGWQQARAVLLEPSTPGCKKSRGWRPWRRPSLDETADSDSPWEECWPTLERQMQAFRLCPSPGEIVISGNRLRQQQTESTWRRAVPDMRWIPLDDDMTDHFAILDPRHAAGWLNEIGPWLSTSIDPVSARST